MPVTHYEHHMVRVCAQHWRPWSLLSTSHHNTRMPTPSETIWLYCQIARLNPIKAVLQSDSFCSWLAEISGSISKSDTQLPPVKYSFTLRTNLLGQCVLMPWLSRLQTDDDDDDDEDDLYKLWYQRTLGPCPQRSKLLGSKWAGQWHSWMASSSSSSSSTLGSMPVGVWHLFHYLSLL